MVFDATTTSPDWSSGINSVRDNILLCPACDGVKSYVLQQVKKTSKACHRFTEQSDPEALHDFRVALRRLRTWLRSYKRYHNVNKKVRKGLRSLADSTNRCRDLEVCITRLESYQPDMKNHADKRKLEWLVDRLTGEYELAFKEIRHRVPKDWHELKGKLIKQINTDKKDDTGNLLSYIAGRKILKTCRSIDDNLALIHNIENRSAIHKTRIYFKRLRYLLEPFSRQIPVSPEIMDLLKNIQDILGEYRDTHILVGLIDEYMKSQTASPGDILGNTGNNDIMFGNIIKHTRQLEQGQFDRFMELRTNGNIPRLMNEIRNVANNMMH